MGTLRTGNSDEPYRFGDVVEWDVRSGNPRWLVICEARNGDGYIAIYLSDQGTTGFGSQSYLGACHPKDGTTRRVNEVR